MVYGTLPLFIRDSSDDQEAAGVRLPVPEYCSLLLKVFLPGPL
jgi:hypothetical protein